MAMKLDFFKKYCNKRNILFVFLFISVFFLFNESAFAVKIADLTPLPTNTNDFILYLHAAMQIV